MQINAIDANKKGKRARLHATCVVIVQKRISFVFVDKLDKVLVQITLMSIGKGFKRGKWEWRDGFILPPFLFLNSL
jgi:hypothetical protein